MRCRWHRRFRLGWWRHNLLVCGPLGLYKRDGIVDIKPAQLPGEPRPRLTPRRHRGTRLRSRRSSAGRAAGGHQLAKVGALLSNQRDIGKTDPSEPANRFYCDILCLQPVDGHNADQHGDRQ